MEPDDAELIQFLTTVFYDMRMKSAKTDAINLSSPDRTRAKPYAKFKQQLNVMYRALSPMHRSGFETLFKFLPLNHSNAFHLMSAHCSAIWDECSYSRDVFLCLMYTCSFTYSLLSFCEIESNVEFQYLFPRWIVKVYSETIKAKFKSANGWVGLNRFCSARNLHFILDFVNLCYNKQGKLFTNIKLGSRMYFYGFHHDDTLLLLKKTFPEFKQSIFKEFKTELDDNMIYKAGVMMACIKIELAFDHTANVYDPPSPIKRLLFPTVVLLEYYVWYTIQLEIPKTITRLLNKQIRIRVEQKLKRIKQERDRAKQERMQAMEKRFRLNQQISKALQKQTKKISAEQERVSANVIKLFAILQQSIDVVNLGLTSNEHASQASQVWHDEHAPLSGEEHAALSGEVNDHLSGEENDPLSGEEHDHLSTGEHDSLSGEVHDNLSGEDLDVEEQVSVLVEQVSTIVEKIATREEEYPTLLQNTILRILNPEEVLSGFPPFKERFFRFLKQVTDNADQNHVVINTVPTADKISSSATGNVPGFRTEKPFLKVVLVKEPPDNAESVRYTKKDFHSCCCRKSRK